MDRNTITGLLLIGLILIGTFYFIPGKKEDPKIKANTIAVDSGLDVRDTLANNLSNDSVDIKSPSSNVAPTLPEGWAGFTKGENKEVTLENERMIVRISSLGGKVSFVQLKDYKTYDGKPVILLDQESTDFGYQFFANGYEVNTADLYFTPTEQDSNSVSMKITLQGGESIIQTYKLPEKGYMLDYRLSMVNMNSVIPRKNQFLNLHWSSKIFQHEKDSEITFRNTAIFYKKLDETPDEFEATKEEHEDIKQQVKWISMKQQFFCQSLITNNTPFTYGDVSMKMVHDRKYIKNLSADLVLPYKHAAQENYDMSFYFGPLKYNSLKELNLDLERQIPLGWSFFVTSWVNRFMIIPIFNWLNNYFTNYGIIILILTIFIKIIVLPLTYKSYLTTAKMRLLKPELDELKAKFVGDMARQQSEQMKLYKSAGVSPFGGCLPLLLQFPILIAMFRFFPSSIELRQESFLWTHDLSTYDSIANLPFHIPFYGSHVSLWTLLMTISTLIYTRINNSLTPQQSEFKWLSYFMPIMFLGFFNNYAAGLSMYYFFFNILTFGQQYIFKLVIDDNKLHAQLEANKRRPNVSKKSGFQKKLEDLSRKQQEIAKQQQQRKGKR